MAKNAQTDAIRIAAAVVIYNRRCEDSAACRSLRRAPGVAVYVMDNSTVDQGNAAWCAAMGWCHRPMGGNAGLPKAYNAALNEAEGLFDILVLLDDDTTVPTEYFQRLRSQAAESTADVFAPRVRDEGGLLSPCRIRGHRVRRAAAVDRWQDDLTAINSGLALRLPVHAAARYDEGYFLDYADHAFVRCLKAAGAAFEVLDVELGQAFSNNARGDVAAALKRLRLFRADFSRFCADSPAGRAYGALYLCKRALVLALRHRSLAFVRELAGRR